MPTIWEISIASDAPAFFMTLAMRIGMDNGPSNAVDRARIDPGRTIDWSNASRDYAEYRPGPPDSFYGLLRALGVGLPGQRILDLGTGTGALARRFANQGAVVTGIDIAEGQIDQARALSSRDGLNVDFQVTAAEKTCLPSGSFDVITVFQAWLYFKKPDICREVKRLLDSGGRLVTGHFCWLPRLDPIARRSEELVLKYNPQWTGADFSGDIPACPAWSRDDFRVSAMCFYDERIAFTRQSWRGRVRACRGIGATLSEEEIKRFDADHQRLLEKTAPEAFTVLHRVDCHVFEPVAGQPLPS
jgi:SAM-dependent methyltransferase